MRKDSPIRSASIRSDTSTLSVSSSSTGWCPLWERIGSNSNAMSPSANWQPVITATSFTESPISGSDTVS
ncbi:hypothetical protein [Actinomadura xylanilytica]|uniref:hypothetical protein n=1 Tax=Actinomadura xylanilytica TaxID=887459 RepID=UPI00255ABD08|nr:hypothetical protein [Actinomadura xylanilytica]MDL4776878.1 hypothetical protein [Actinomadura xylanilytica]